MTSREQVLVVDDDEGVCRLISGALKKAGITAQWRTSGEEALTWLRGHPDSLLLLDLRLADMTGRKILDTLAAEDRTVPFIVISGVADVKIAVDLMKEGALDFLPKDTQLLQLVVPVVRRSLDRLQEQRRLAEAERRFVELAENIQSVFWIADPNFDRFVYINPAYEKFWGTPLRTVYERADAWMDAVLPGDLPQFRAALRRLKKSGEPIEVEFRIRRPDGEMRWLQCSASALRDGAGQIERLTGFVRDVTDRKEMNRRLVDTAEQERRRLGQDLHDDLCQRLAAIKLRCGMLARNLAREDSPHAGELEELSAAIGDATALSRSFARGLCPVALDSDGLPSALNSLAKSATTIFGIPVSFSCPDPVVLADSDTAAHLYRIAQELISNAAKHAHPQNIEVRLVNEAGQVILEVSDDGTPFDGRSGTGEGMGHHFLRSRADAVGARLEFLPGIEPECGTLARCTLTLTSQPHES